MQQSQRGGVKDMLRLIDNREEQNQKQKRHRAQMRQQTNKWDVLLVPLSFFVEIRLLSKKKLE